MRSVRDVMADLVDTGLSPDQQLLIMELTGALAAETKPETGEDARPRSKGAQRTARWRDRKASQTSQKTSQVTECDDVTSQSVTDGSASPRPPSPPEPTPLSPLKGAYLPSLVRQIAEAIWSEAPKKARERSSRQDVVDHLTAAIRRGHAPERVRDGVRAAYASETYGGEHAKGVHRLIEKDRWLSFVEADPEKPKRSAADLTPDQWGPFVRAFWRDGEWRPSLGPKPGDPGCLAPVDMQMPPGGRPADLPFPQPSRTAA